MIDPDRIRSAVFDFAGTLCSDRYFAPLGQGALAAIGDLLFGANAAAWADPWMKGDLTSRDIAVYLAQHLPEPAEAILAALRQGCARLTFNPAVLGLALGLRRSGRKTALVTANMDVFTEVVVPAHGLDALFDVVLNTADHRTLDKSRLWRKAFAAFGPGHSFASALLIDDSPKMVDLFRSLGGAAHRYEGEQALLAWLGETGFSEILQPEG